MYLYVLYVNDAGTGLSWDARWTWLLDTYPIKYSWKVAVRAFSASSILWISSVYGTHECNFLHDPAVDDKKSPGLYVMESIASQ